MVSLTSSALLNPYLIKIIEMTKTICKYRNPDIDPYELLLDDYEEGMTIKKYDEFFDLIKTRIIPLIHKIEKKNGEVIDDFIPAVYCGDFLLTFALGYSIL